MTDLIPDGHKFACTSLKGANIILNQPFIKLNADNSLFTDSSNPFKLDKYWQELLGTLLFDSFRKSNLVLISHSPSQDPDLLGPDNEQLMKEVKHLLNSIIISEILSFEVGITITGPKTNGKYVIRKMQDIPRRFHEKATKKINLGNRL